MSDYYWLTEAQMERLRPHFPKSRGKPRVDDRQHPHEGPPHSGKPLKRGIKPRAIGCTKGGLNSKLHRVSDGRGRPLSFFLSPGQMSDARGAVGLLGDLPKAKRLLGDKGYDADWFRDELKRKGVRTCIPPRAKRKKPASYNRRLYRKRHRIENAFARLKNWRRIATRYDRCGDLFPSAICIAAIVFFWLPK